MIECAVVDRGLDEREKWSGLVDLEDRGVGDRGAEIAILTWGTHREVALRV